MCIRDSEEDGAAHRDPEHHHADMCILISYIQEAAMASFTSLFANQSEVAHRFAVEAKFCVFGTVPTPV